MSFIDSELMGSGYIHSPLPLHREHSLEEELKKIPVLKEVILSDLNDLKEWSAVGDGEFSHSFVSTPEGGKGISFFAESPCEQRPMGRLEEGDCSNYGQFGIELKIARENWEDYNQLSFYLRADCEGVRHVSVNLCFKNDGKIKIPDIYHRDGYHVMNLNCGEWMRFTIQIDTLPRDQIISLIFCSNKVGCETNADLGNQLHFTLGDLKLQQAAYTENTLGWELPQGKIAYCYSGYFTNGKKTAVVALPSGSSFSVLNGKKNTVLKGVSEESNGYNMLSIIDFSSVTEVGEYTILTDTEETDPFQISDQVYQDSIWKTINFFFCQRCGYPVPGYHQSCHRDIMAYHGDKSFFCCGGWHDAGDVSQQLIQTAEITYALFEAASALKNNTLLHARLREEGLWGIDYVLKSRFGDGYRATSVGVSVWTQGFLGDKDDIRSRCHNNAYDNFLCAAVEAYCSMELKDEDPQLSDRLLACAKMDFSFALERFSVTGYSETPPEYWEHSFMTSPSLFAATICWSASLLYRASHSEEYLEIAVEYGDYILSCQAWPDENTTHFPVFGFFYRDSKKKSLQHFNHQAREQVYMHALIELCKTQPTHPSYENWRKAIQLYGDYLKTLMRHGNPYGMIPSGLYRTEELEDSHAMLKQHLETGEEMNTNYILQLNNGKNLGEGFYLKQFPVWFSFRGNNAVILSMGKSASLCGHFLKDKELLDIAAAQLEWNVGKNPFRQSLMYGEGKRYAQQYAVMSGEITGELPVGIQTLENGDVPYWPQMNNATYKEIWTTPSGKWLSILADIYIAMDNYVIVFDYY